MICPLTALASHQRRPASLHPSCGVRTLPDKGTRRRVNFGITGLQRPFGRLRKALTFNSPDPLQI